MKTVAVIGGGPAGAMAAETLARGGMRTILLDEKLAWEKPCGGGVTQKAYLQYPFLNDAAGCHASIRQCALRYGKAKAYELLLRHPVLVYSRKALNQLLLDRAGVAGADVEKVRIVGVERGASGGWNLLRNGASIAADHLVIATGARNSIRQFGTEWDARNSMLAIGYYLPGKSSSITIQFFPHLQGYLWLFPRGDHISAGICGKGATQKEMRAMLESYLDQQGIPWQGAAFYAHLIPALESAHWQRNRIAGDGWMAIGDAAGLVDPLTGEGIFYAMRSGELAGRALLGMGDPGTAYQQQLRSEFVEELELAAKLAKLFYLGETGLGAVPHRMIQLARHNDRIRDLLQDLVSGAQNYTGLRNKVSDSLHGRVMATMVKYLRTSYERLEGTRSQELGSGGLKVAQSSEEGQTKW